MKYVLGFDFETTGLDATKDRVIEVGAALWDWERKQPMAIVSRLCWHEDNGLEPEIPELISKLTGITGRDLKEFSISTEHAIGEMFLSCPSDAVIMAHNAPFDLGFLQAECDRFLIKNKFKDMPVIDTRVDLPLDNELHKSKALVHLAATHGFLNPFAHRAIFDVLTMLKVASHYDLETILMRSKSPVIEVTAHVSFEQKDLAKSAGFQWNPSDKTWRLRIKECDLKPNVDWGFKTSSRPAIATQ